MIYPVLPMWNPWATLVVIGSKTNETRSRDTKIRGTVLIHACKKWNQELLELSEKSPFHDFLFKWAYENDIGGNKYLKQYFGHIIGAVDIVETYKIVDSYGHPSLYLGSSIFKDGDTTQTFSFENVVEPELSFGDYSIGRYAWKLENPRELVTPIPYKAQQGFSSNKYEAIEPLLFKHKQITQAPYKISGDEMTNKTWYK